MSDKRTSARTSESPSTRMASTDNRQWGLTLWAALAIMATSIITGMLISSSTGGGQLDRWYFICFALGSIVAVATVQLRGLLITTCAQPIFFTILTPIAAMLAGKISGTTANTPTFAKTAILTDIFPIVQRFPWLGWTLFLSILIAIGRLVFHRMQAKSADNQRQAALRKTEESDKKNREEASRYRARTTTPTTSGQRQKSSSRPTPSGEAPRTGSRLTTSDHSRRPTQSEPRISSESPQARRIQAERYERPRRSAPARMRENRIGEEGIRRNIEFDRRPRPTDSESSHTASSGTASSHGARIKPDNAGRRSSEYPRAARRNPTAGRSETRNPVPGRNESRNPQISSDPRPSRNHYRASESSEPFPTRGSSESPTPRNRRSASFRETYGNRFSDDRDRRPRRGTGRPRHAREDD